MRPSNKQQYGEVPPLDEAIFLVAPEWREKQLMYARSVIDYRKKQAAQEQFHAPRGVAVRVTLGAAVPLFLFACVIIFFIGAHQYAKSNASSSVVGVMLDPSLRQSTPTMVPVIVGGSAGSAGVAPTSTPLPTPTYLEGVFDCKPGQVCAAHPANAP